METYLNHQAEFLKQKGAYWTAKEINQQPNCWLEIFEKISSEQKQIQQWLAPTLEKDGIRIIFTGAGTSAYIGDMLAPYLTQENGHLFESISTTDLVAAPQQYLPPTTPVLLVSFGRSGNSPESVAAINMINQCVNDVYHLVITCNQDGELAQYAIDTTNAYSVVLPEQTHDVSFAMTSSASTMVMAALSIFDHNRAKLNQLLKASDFAFKHLNSKLTSTISNDNQRIIFIGSGCLLGLAQEASLKYLELTAGKIDSYFQSSLGLRHGPKFAIDDQTQVIIFCENNAYTRQYDLDLYQELKHDGVAQNIVFFDHNDLDGQHLEGTWLALVYLVYAQFLAMEKSIKLGSSPDTPCETGQVNRVVQGVNIHPYHRVK
ncbi:SIS domain-containing protein [Parashewanella spongiae]|uniref:SIS domain-containing protein n=1 Tax=Parashewanella spongiae TaxID=342950 RepID=A0A3A6TVS9_9GAMM|nr:SIS domain-containing protein [Parashewanella spongiae]MCL1077948.1 SIS domain-containing protein [Parashewanella spongiae]RJY18432.1 SIS domain-containing protein [Parashewanella spongiae]